MKVKKFLKGFMAAALAVTMMVTPVSSVMCNSLTVFAAPETMPDGTVFDAEYYAQTYPDVANAVGTDRDALYNHYVTFGKAEGRMACAPTTTVQADKTPTEPSAQSKDPLTARTTPTQALVYTGLFPDFMLTDSRPALESYSSGSSRKYEYDAYGNMIKVDGISLDYYCVCDAEGRIVGIRGNSYADEDMTDNCIYNEQGQLIQLDSFTTYKFYYDDLGRLINIGGIEFRYDEQRRTVSKYLAESVYEYIYDEQGRLVEKIGHESNKEWYQIYEYDASGKLARTKYASRLFYSSSSNFSPETISTEFSYN